MARVEVVAAVEAVLAQVLDDALGGLMIFEGRSAGAVDEQVAFVTMDD